jgi:NNP family nitrate/nitrite transporter-like MFS transporter
MIWPRQELPRRIVAGRLSGPETVPQRSREDLVTSTAANDTTLRTGPTYLKNVYAFGLTGAGTRTAGFAIAAVIARPIGGIVADKVGPRIVVAISLAGAAVMSLVIALRLPPELAAGTAFVLMALFLGLGTGGVFAWVAKLAPAERVGAITGIVGAAGGLGGFFPPLVMGATYNEAAHSYTIGLVLLTITAGGALLFTLFGIRRKAAARA